MITSRSFNMASLWLTESFSTKESLLLPECGLLSDLPFDSLDTSTDALSCLQSEWDAPTPGMYHLSDISVANSECSEELSPVIDGDLEDSLFMRTGNGEFLTSAVMNLIGDTINNNGDNHFTNDLISGTMSLTPEDDSGEDTSVYDDLLEDHEDSFTAIPTSVSRRKRSLSETLSHKIKWSVLTSTEQFDLVEDMSAVISRDLGLREQIEVIRIINPHATVSPSDAEFVIDLSCLNDERLRRVQDFIHQHTRCHRNDHTSANLCGKSCSKRPGSSHHHDNNSRSKRCCGHDNGCQGTSHKEGTSYRTQKPMKHVQNEGTLHLRKQDDRKINRQQKKEDRSGLFVREEVISVTCCDQDEDPDDVDILD